ncbi:MAG: rRNA maturation RNase YbeY [Porticoccaceae bacterium]|jgi:probable rRNA maturation factor|nr:rRNA maturation RNase YbeY [Cellvibrionales bacterium]MDB2360756.1 rRNA maturation RNase YbeY [Porticoccaceae bacterium]MDB3926236.1 rRNA maturation RNase YbeY [Porticoccaceae bacterium]
MTLIVDIQMASASEEAPDPQSIERWIGAAIGNQRESTELSVRIVDAEEGQALNEQFRGSTGATNVLSFPFENESPEPLPLIGDIVICAPVVAKEAREQNKALNAHWAHMMIHGVLHLLGYDHQNENDANLMESLETEIMQGLGFPPPYSCQ